MLSTLAASESAGALRLILLEEVLPHFDAPPDAAPLLGLSARIGVAHPECAALLCAATTDTEPTSTQRWVAALREAGGGCGGRRVGRGVPRSGYDAVLGLWRVRRELLALGIGRSPREFAPVRGPPSLW